MLPKHRPVTRPSRRTPHCTCCAPREAQGTGCIRRSADRLPLLLALLLVAGFAGACRPEAQQHPAGRPAVDTAAITASLDSLAGKVMRAHQTRDAELFATTWARDGIMSGPGSPPVQGREAVVDAFLRTPPLPPGAKMTIHPSEIRVMNEEWAYAFGTDSLTYTPQGASEPLQETYTFLVLLRKTPEGWQTYREVLSANQPSSVLR